MPSSQPIENDKIPKIINLESFPSSFAAHRIYNWPRTYDSELGLCPLAVRVESIVPRHSTIFFMFSMIAVMC